MARNQNNEVKDNVQVTAAAAAAVKPDNGEIEIDLAELALHFLEKIHWIILTALIGAAIAFGIWRPSALRSPRRNMRPIFLNIRSSRMRRGNWKGRP